jgi:hypothetical protein
VSNPVHLSREEFDKNKQDILDALDALLLNPKSRRRFRDLELYEKTTGELLAEVFHIRFGTVVVHRSYGRVSLVGNAPFFRQGASQDDLIVAPLTGDPLSAFTS